MKTAAFIILLGSTAFAATPSVPSSGLTVESTTATPPKAPVAPAQTSATKKSLKQAQASQVAHAKGPQQVKAPQQTKSPQQVKGPQAKKPQQAVAQNATDPNLQAPSNMQQRTKMDPTVSASSPEFADALAKRRAKTSLAVTAPSEPGIKAPKFGDWELKAQLRHDMTFANVEQQQDIGGKNFGMSDEIRIGMKNKSGWGFSLTGAYNTDSYADPSKNIGSNGDASIIVFHPSIYKDNTFDLYGYLRAYLPTSETSRENNVRTMRYYSLLDITLAKRFSLSNTMILAGKTQSGQTDTTGNGFVYDSVELSHASAKGISLAFGIQGENDFKVNAAPDQEIDVYPFIDITLIPNLLIEPKYYFPIFTQGGATQGASGAALNQSVAELFIKLAI